MCTQISWIAECNKKKKTHSKGKISCQEGVKGGKKKRGKTRGFGSLINGESRKQARHHRCGETKQKMSAQAPKGQSKWQIAKAHRKSKDRENNELISGRSSKKRNRIRTTALRRAVL